MEHVRDFSRKFPRGGGKMKKMECMGGKMKKMNVLGGQNEENGMYWGGGGGKPSHQWKLKLLAGNCSLPLQG